MKSVLAALFLSIAAPIMADEIRFETAPWDSLAIPLGINAYYLHIDSPAEAKSALLTIDIYREGKLVKTLTGTGCTLQKKAPLELNAAVYFNPEKEGRVPGMVVLEWNNSRASVRFDHQASDLPFDKVNSSVLKGTVAAQGRTPVFRIQLGSSSSSFHDSIEKTIEANTEGTLMIGYLVTE